MALNKKIWIPIGTLLIIPKWLKNAIRIRKLFSLPACIELVVSSQHIIRVTVTPRHSKEQINTWSRRTNESLAEMPLHIACYCLNIIVFAFQIVLSINTLISNYAHSIYIKYIMLVYIRARGTRSCAHLYKLRVIFCFHLPLALCATVLALTNYHFPLCF